jgi:16S rRNA (guanine(966)-N(2))-methyltransferase RsmD
MSRIIGGAGKGRRLKTAQGAGTRPTGARVRQSLFDILAPLIPGSRFLDAFAGSGGVALEALSRGAAKVVLVDRSAAAIAAARQNVAALAAAGGEAVVFKQEARTALRAFAGQGERFDVVFLDPPYDSDLYEPLLELAGDGLLAEEGLAIAEHFHKRPLPERIGALVRTRLVRVGDHYLSFYRHAASPGAGGELQGEGGDEDEAP